MSAGPRPDEPHRSAFDVTGELPQGTTVLEASAGTGKTYAIAALAVRYVAEGRARLADLLLITFSRAATRELRERVRAALLDAERSLARAEHDHRAPEGLSPLHSMLLHGTPEQVHARRARLADAISSFDSATIETTHSFCLRMLAGLGVAGNHDPGAELVEDLDDELRRCVDDLYLARYAPAGAPFTPEEALQIARAVAFQPESRLEPVAAEPDSADAQRTGFAEAVRSEVARRFARRRVLGFDDLQLRLRDALQDPSSGPLAARLLHERYRVVLVDEFQDTDPVQWDILRLAFHARSTLVLIGDPKQAIYAFRGGDIATYLRATEAADHHRMLATNWRSDAEVVDGLQHLLGGLALGDPRIVVRPVGSRHRGRLTGAGPGVRIRRLTREGLPVTGSGRPTVAGVRQAIVDDLATDLARLLSAPAQVQVHAARRPLSAGDVAVLVPSHAHAEIVRRRLTDAGIAVVLAGGTSVFASAAAEHWKRLLEALDSGHRPAAVRALAVSPFVGWSGARLAQARLEQSPELDELATAVRSWSRLLAARGVAAVLEAVSISTDLPGRLLAVPGGERELTDLRHVGEALHEAAQAEHLGVSGLRRWLRERTAAAGKDAARERSRRLASDADAVTIATVHAAKGLEFPLVYVPFAADRHRPSTPFPVRFTDDSGRRVLDVGTSASPGHGDRLARHQQAEDDEDLRRLYVALTRAASQVVTWWAPSTNVTHSALHRVLFAARSLDGRLDVTAPVPPDVEVASRLSALAQGSGGTIAVEEVAVPAAGPPGADRPGVSEPAVTGASTTGLDPAAAPEQLHVRRWTRRLDTAWRRTSYTALTAAAHDAAHPPGIVAGSEPEVEQVEDEPAGRTTELLDAPVSAPDPSDPAQTVARQMISPWHDLPAGAAFGTVVHELLEVLEPADAADAEATAATARKVVSRLGADLDPEALAAAVVPAMTTPLAALLPGTRLCDVSAADRLCELDFELPLGGGEQPVHEAAVLADVAAALQRHLPAADPLATYPQRLTGPAMPTTQLRGYLTGSIDVVLRTGTGEDARYVVVDYKTNRLPARDPAAATAWDYRPAALARAMMEAHYPLQAALYSVALHRFLRWRHPGYDPSRHLGGIAYLFLRGMCGPSTPVLHGSTCGVFAWQPAPELVVELSDLLAGRRR